MALKSFLPAISIIILAGGITMEFFIILSGGSTASPLNKVYFLQADTSGISSGNGSPVPNPARWTYFSICGVHNGNNANCGKQQAALPFDPVKNFGTQTNVPEGLIHDPSYYYYMSRVAWAFYMMALVFAVVALFLSVLAMCSRLASKFTGLVTLIAVIMQAVAASLMTVWTYKGRHAFRSNGQSAKLGTYAYAFSWTAFTCFLISTILFCMGGGRDKSESTQSGYFGRKRSTRSRGSFRDSESGRRVKDEYE